MDEQQFREAAHKVIEDIIAYNKELENTPPVGDGPSSSVLSSVEHGYLAQRLPTSLPQAGESFDEIRRDFHEHVMPGITHWQSPNFMAYFPANFSYPALLADMYSDMVTCAAFNWQASPAVTEMEVLVLDMLASAFGLGDQFQSKGKGGGVIVGSASEATLTFMIAARERYLTLHPEVKVEDLVCMVSDQTHACSEKAANLLGIQCVKVKTVAEQGYRMTEHNVRQAISELAEGKKLFYIVPSFGSTGLCVVDDLPGVNAAVAGLDVWVHLDAAYAGAALICPEVQAQLSGQFDSIDINAHKWFLTNFDCSCAWLSDRKYLLQAMDLTPSYLRNAHSDAGSVVDYRNWGIPLGRRFRSLKLWFVLRTYGIDGMRDHVRRHMRFSDKFVELVRADETMTVVDEPRFALCVFRFDDDDVSRRVYERVNADGRLFITSAVIGGRYVIRVVAGSPYVTEAHLVAAYHHIAATYRKVVTEQASEVRN